jgi:hypothetical protein
MAAIGSGPAAFVVYRQVLLGAFSGIESGPSSSMRIAYTYSCPGFDLKKTKVRLGENYGHGYLQENNKPNYLPH